MAKAGRKPKLTKELIQKLADVVAAGNYLSTACNYVGIGETTAYKWLADAELPGARPLFIEFREAINKAKAAAEIRNVTKIQKAAEENWNAAAWYLSRAHKERWGPNTSIQLTGSGGGPVDVEVGAKDTLLTFLRDRRELLEPGDGLDGA